MGRHTKKAIRNSNTHSIPNGMNKVMKLISYLMTFLLIEFRLDLHLLCVCWKLVTKNNVHLLDHTPNLKMLSHLTSKNSRSDAWIVMTRLMCHFIHVLTLYAELSVSYATCCKCCNQHTKSSYFFRNKIIVWMFLYSRSDGSKSPSKRVKPKLRRAPSSVRDSGLSSASSASPSIPDEPR